MAGALRRRLCRRYLFIVSMPLTSADLGPAVAIAERQGWTVLDTSSSPEHIASVVRGWAVPHGSRDRRVGVERILPRPRVGGPLRSLSAQHGLGPFPFHTDGAHWRDPPRWVLLWCERDEQGRDSLLLPWAALFGEGVARQPGTFLVRNGRASFFTLVGEFARLDLGCMIPQDPSADRIVHAMKAAGARSARRITWTEGRMLVIDNFATLHGRSMPTGSHVTAGRILWRALIGGDPGS